MTKNCPKSIKSIKNNKKQNRKNSRKSQQSGFAVIIVVKKLLKN